MCIQSDHFCQIHTSSIDSVRQILVFLIEKRKNNKQRVQEQAFAFLFAHTHIFAGCQKGTSLDAQCRYIVLPHKIHLTNTFMRERVTILVSFARKHELQKISTRKYIFDHKSTIIVAHSTIHTIHTYLYNKPGTTSQNQRSGPPTNLHETVLYEFLIF